MSAGSAAFYTPIAVLRAGLAALALLLLASSACGDGDGPQVGTAFTPENGSPNPLVTPITPVPKPGAIPETARAITQTTKLGRIVRRAGQSPQAVMTRQITAASCVDGLMTIATSGETIYAPLDCSSFWGPDTTALFVGEQTSISLEAASTRFRIFIETLPGAQAEFTVYGIWVE